MNRTAFRAYSAQRASQEPESLLGPNPEIAVAEEDNSIAPFSLMFESACSLTSGAQTILAGSGTPKNGETAYPIVPVLVCSALAVELLLKALLRKLEVPLPRGDLHDLERLFQAVPEDVRGEILHHQTAYTQVPDNEALSLLRHHKDVFKQWRYPYEHDHLSVRPSFLFGFARSLTDYIQSEYTVERSMKGWLAAPDAKP